MAKPVSRRGEGRPADAAWKWLYEQRVRRNLTQKAAAEDCGTRQQTWGGWEQARRRPPRRFWQALAQFADIDVPELRTEIGKAFPRSAEKQ